MGVDCLTLRGKVSFGAFFRRIPWWHTVRPVVAYSRSGYHHIVRVVDDDAVAPKAPGENPRNGSDETYPNPTIEPHAEI
jgi:hypothetical protein